MLKVILHLSVDNQMNDIFPYGTQTFISFVEKCRHWALSLASLIQFISYSLYLQNSL
jgi:hypothetical protein